MEKDLISVIVPIYNIEDYIETCINSIIKQTYKNIEIILINDGSTDESERICNELKEKDSRIFVYYKKNGGLSSARNFGISKAKGKYITTIDGDDFVGEQYIKKLYKLLIENDTDISMINRYNFLEDVENGITNKELYYENKLENYVFDNKLCEYYILKNIIPHEAWGKLYKREIFEDNKYKEGLEVFEDLEFLLRVLKKDSIKIVYDPKEYEYYYRKRSSSIMNSNYNKCWEKEIEYLCSLKKDMYYKEYNKLITNNIGHAIIRNFKKITQNRLDKELIKDLKKYVKESSIFITEGEKSKIFLLLIKYIPNILYNFLIMQTKKEKNFIKLFNEYKEKNNNQTFIFNGPTTGNMGDHAILFAEEQILKEQGNEPFLISSKEMKYFFANNLDRHVTNKATIYITGGGNTGSLWRNEQERINTVLKKFCSHKIIVFPQTIYYSDDFFGKECLKKDKKLYKKCSDITFECRDKKTYKFVNEDIKIKTILKKDVALTLDYTNLNLKRNGIIFCFRKDIEKVIDDEMKEMLINKIIDTTNINKIRYTDTVIKKRKEYSYKSAKKEFNKLVREFASSKLVVTDRLHGMIIAHITGTPCVAINNLSKKVKGVYDTIEDKENIIFIDDIKKIEKEEEKWKKLKDLLNA